MTLPYRLILICDADAAVRAGTTLADATARVLDAVPRDAPLAFMVRDKSSRSDDEIASWALPLAARCASLGGPKVIVHTRTALAARLGAHALHLADGAPLDPPPALPVRGVPLRIGRSIHRDTDAEGGAAYTLLAPVFAPTSKAATSPPLGLAVLAARAHATPTPLFALGGVTLENAASCRAHGAYGVAVLGAWLQAPDGGAYGAALLRAITVS